MICRKDMMRQILKSRSFNLDIKRHTRNEKCLDQILSSVMNRLAVPEKCMGSTINVTTRPDPAAFVAAVEDNCFKTCVVTGSRIHVRCEAAHLVVHSAEGVDHDTNVVWSRADIHDLLDAGYCAINPETLELFFTDEALSFDPDLLVWHGKALRPTKRPINPAYLCDRWADFCLTGSCCA